MSLIEEFFSKRTNDQRFPSIASMERAAQRRTPKFAWDYLAGGVGDEKGLARNLSDFDRVKMMPRYLQDLEPGATETTVLGQTHPLPFGPSPVGLSGLIWPNTPLHIARGAKKHGLPAGLSSVATNSLEEVGKIFSVTRERVRQIESKAVRKLQQPYRSRSLASFLDGVDHHLDQTVEH